MQYYFLNNIKWKQIEKYSQMNEESQPYLVKAVALMLNNISVWIL